MISTTLNYDFFLEENIVTFSNSAVETSDIQVEMYPAWFDNVTLEWSLPVEWADPKVSIYKSNTYDRNYIKVTDAYVDGTSWKDLDTLQDSKSREDFYKIEAVLADGSVYLSEPVYLENKRVDIVRRKANDISRRHNLCLRKFLGVEAYLFRKKTYGKRCEDCWNEEHEKIIKNNCTTCFGTSFEGGYWPISELYMNFSQSGDNRGFNYQGKMEVNQVSSWTTSWPRLHSDDIIVRLDDKKLFRVSGVQRTELQSELLRQIATLNELPHSSAEYGLLFREGLSK